jgi:type I restriction enzyme M protein
MDNQMSLFRDKKITNQIINNLLEIKESYELPDKLMALLLDNNSMIKLFDKFMGYDVDLTKDIFRDYFQEQHADRKSLKQDYTPDAICKIISKLQNEKDTLLDVCSGTGALSIFSYNENNDLSIVCEELSQRSISTLLFNLAIRNVKGYVLRKDVLKNEILDIYKLEKGERYSIISKVENIEKRKYNTIISNPPYSLEWQPIADERFNTYELAPKSKADFAFILDILYRLDENGKAFMILPHGILFRGQAEGKIRKQLIDNNLIDSIIGLPDKMFLNTQIPTCILILNKNKKDNNILFIDSSKNCINQAKQNDMSDVQINKIIETYQNRNEIEKYSHLASYKEVIENDYNLNIPRYVDTFEDEPLPDLREVVQDMIRIEKETKETEHELKKMLEQLEGTTPEEKEYYSKAIKPLMEWLV